MGLLHLLLLRGRAMIWSGLSDSNRGRAVWKTAILPTELSPRLSFLLVAALLVNCTRTVEVKAETHETASLVEKQLSKEKVVETVQVGPETITTTVEEFEIAPPLLLSSGQHLPSFDGPEQSAGPVSARGAAPIMPPAPILVKRTITVDQRGPSIDTKASEATASSSATQAIKLDSKTETTTKTRYGPPLWLLALLAAALALVVWLVWRFSLFGRIAAFFR